MELNRISYRMFEEKSEAGQHAVRFELLKEGYDLIPYEEGKERLEPTDQYHSCGKTWRPVTERDTPEKIPHKRQWICRRGLGADGTPDKYAGHRIMNNLRGVE